MLTVVAESPNTGQREHNMIGQFTAYQHVRGFRTTTIARRTSTLTQFSKLINPTPISTATEGDISEFLSMFESPRTRHAYRSDLSVFYKWAHRRGMVETNPCDLIDPIRVPKTLPRPITVAQVWLLLNSATSYDLRLMVALAAFAGLRVSEIANLDIDDVDTVKGVLMVRAGKGNKDRAIPLHPVLCDLIVNSGRRRGRLVPFTADTIGRRIAEHMRGNGIESTAHKLRATFATELAEMARGNIVMVQRLLGHSSPTTTMLYVGWGGGEAADTVAGMYGAAG